MSTKQGDSRNKINTRRITLYAMLVAICLIVGYLENLLSLSLIAIAPGVKIGLSNAIILALVCQKDIKGAWMINVVRICLSAVLFGSPVSFLLSLSGGVASLLLASCLSRSKNISVIGVSMAAAVTHNVFQLAAATLIVGLGAIYYLPILIGLGSVCGALCGILAQLIGKKTKTFGF